LSDSCKNWNSHSGSGFHSKIWPQVLLRLRQKS